MCEEYVTTCPFVSPYSNKFTIFGLYCTYWVDKTLRKICLHKSARAKNLTFRNSGTKQFADMQAGKFLIGKLQ